MVLKLQKPEHLFPAEIDLPGSKSISNRVLIIQALSGLDFGIQNISDSDDTLHLQSALSNYAKTSVIDVGHAGTDMRFLTAFLSLQKGNFELRGSERLQQRPVKDLVSVLKELGADISYKKEEGYAPLIIKGKPLNGGAVKISGKVSSQFITALLLVAPYFKEGLVLHITDETVSKPYIEMTIAIMKEFGAEVSWLDNQITVGPRPYSYSRTEYKVERDWSAASYYYSMVALSPLQTKIILSGLFNVSTQGDSVCEQIYQRFGVTTEYHKDKIILTKSVNHLSGMFELNLVECPDIAQTLVCTCIGLECAFRFTGLQTLKVKETDRIAALQQEARKSGIELEVSDNSIQWIKTTPLKYDSILAISTYKDHRMAMSFAPLCLVVEELCIEDPEVVSKSYPLFWEHLKQIGITQTQS
ncbi:MAG: 3-phosphoshikimate 1-carboxyvinyltransferase [Bacteroidetes bacterium]|jgi:3-phosphoshikimate 1-carboxyvinyltransferase|nr:3-phosphoshikimate 1-carboxyvinyltransferase [Bacteroidota bacterium]MDF2452011.1 3-phosphoshikimate 1-carboxyvinyltransferase [Bacteroidota bacterium]